MSDKVSSFSLTDVMKELNLEFSESSFDKEWMYHNLNVLSNHIAYKYPQYDEELLSNLLRQEEFQTYLKYQMIKNIIKNFEI